MKGERSDSEWERRIRELVAMHFTVPLDRVSHNERARIERQVRGDMRTYCGYKS